MITSDESGRDHLTLSNVSAVSWAAIFAGAAGAAALSFILLVLGVGLGFSAMSPWSFRGASAESLGISTIIWVAFTQIIASGAGGYLAGRLRVKWADVDRDEVYFRDTAHGFLAWAVASLATAALLGSAISAVLGNGIEAGATVAGGAAAGAVTSTKQAANGPRADPLNYYIDSMFRSTAPESAADNRDNRAEVTRIVKHSLENGQLEPEDKRYLASVVSRRTGLSPEESEKRVSDLYAQAGKAIEDAKTAAKQAADKARKVTAYSALWMFIALLCGAFVASLLATFGGKLRDRIE